MTLSKSQYIRGLQCLKSLWLYKHRPKLRAEPKEETEALFATGYRVGDLAKALFPGGMEMDTFADLHRLKDPSRRDEIRRALLEYCRLDTLAMVQIYERLATLV